MICVFCLFPTLIGIILVFVQHEKNHKGQKVNINSLVKNNLKFIILIIESTRIFSINISVSHCRVCRKRHRDTVGVEKERQLRLKEISHCTGVWAALWLWNGGAAAMDSASVFSTYSEAVILPDDYHRSFISLEIHPKCAQWLTKSV